MKYPPKPETMGFNPEYPSANHCVFCLGFPDKGYRTFSKGSTYRNLAPTKNTNNQYATRACGGDIQTTTIGRGFNRPTKWPGARLSLGFDGYALTTKHDGKTAIAEQTFVIWNKKADTTKRSVWLFGVDNSSIASYWCGFAAPYSTGTGNVIFDFGGFTAGTSRLVIYGQTWTTDEDLWVCTVGPRGMEVWRNGALIGSQSGHSLLYVTTTLATFTVGGATIDTTLPTIRCGSARSTLNDKSSIGYWANYEKEFTHGEIKNIYSDPWGQIRPPAAMEDFSFKGPDPAILTLGLVEIRASPHNPALSIVDAITVLNAEAELSTKSINITHSGSLDIANAEIHIKDNFLSVQTLDGLIPDTVEVHIESTDPTINIEGRVNPGTVETKIDATDPSLDTPGSINPGAAEIHVESGAADLLSDDSSILGSVEIHAEAKQPNISTADGVNLEKAEIEIKDNPPSFSDGQTLTAGKVEAHLDSQDPTVNADSLLTVGKSEIHANSNTPQIQSDCQITADKTTIKIDSNDPSIEADASIATDTVEIVLQTKYVRADASDIVRIHTVEFQVNIQAIIAEAVSNMTLGVAEAAATINGVIANSVDSLDLSSAEAQIRPNAPHLSPEDVIALATVEVETLAKKMTIGADAIIQPTTAEAQITPNSPTVATSDAVEPGTVQTEITPTGVDILAVTDVTLTLDTVQIVASVNPITLESAGYATLGTTVAEIRAQAATMGIDDVIAITKAETKIQPRVVTLTGDVNATLGTVDVQLSPQAVTLDVESDVVLTLGKVVIKLADVSLDIYRPIVVCPGLVGKILNIVAKFGKDVQFEVQPTKRYNASTGHTTTGQPTWISRKISPPVGVSSYVVDTDGLKGGRLTCYLPSCGLPFTPKRYMRVLFDGIYWEIGDIKMLFATSSLGAYELELLR
jgi:hypothetical protein